MYPYHECCGWWWSLMTLSNTESSAKSYHNLVSWIITDLYRNVDEEHHPVVPDRCLASKRAIRYMKTKCSGSCAKRIYFISRSDFFFQRIEDLCSRILMRRLSHSNTTMMQRTPPTAVSETSRSLIKGSEEFEGIDGFKPSSAPLQEPNDSSGR